MCPMGIDRMRRQTKINMLQINLHVFFYPVFSVCTNANQSIKCLLPRAEQVKPKYGFDADFFLGREKIKEKR